MQQQQKNPGYSVWRSTKRSACHCFAFQLACRVHKFYRLRFDNVFEPLTHNIVYYGECIAGHAFLSLKALSHFCDLTAHIRTAKGGKDQARKRRILYGHCS